VLRVQGVVSANFFHFRGRRSQDQESLEAISLLVSTRLPENRTQLVVIYNQLHNTISILFPIESSVAKVPFLVDVRRLSAIDLRTN
jgi:hypothetical protein